MERITANEARFLKAYKRGDFATMLRLLEQRHGADVVRIALGDDLISEMRSMSTVKPRAARVPVA